MAERFWDTTNTFHLHFGEMNITSFDFVVLAGLIFLGEPLVYHEDFHVHCDQLHLFGRIMGSIPPKDHVS